MLARFGRRFDGTYFDFPSTAFDSKEVALGWNSLLLENDLMTKTFLNPFRDEKLTW